MFSYRLLILNFLFAVISSCQKEEKEVIAVPQWSDSEISAEGGTTFDFSINAFGHSLPDLPLDQKIKFGAGNALFRDNWVLSPSSTTGRDGLGPMYNSISCSGCHFKDGRGRPPEEGGSLATMLIRLSIPEMDASGAHLPDANYGFQFNNNAIPGVVPEGDVKVKYIEFTGAYPDGEKYSLRKPLFEFLGLGYGPLHSAIQTSPRVAQQLPGLGFLEAISDNTIIAFSDENDTNADGISGRPNYIYDSVSKKRHIGRFGWKANQVSIRSQVIAAFNGDMGISSNGSPELNLTLNQRKNYPELKLESIDITDSTLDKVIFYCSTLSVPARRSPEQGLVMEGKKLFVEIGCHNCHRTDVKTGIHPQIPQLSNKMIHPYTDLLLHDMGDLLADQRPDHSANGNEWRTPPLWGLGLLQTVSNHTYLLHDGRARNFEEAILWHGGEAQKATAGFKALTKSERSAVLHFLESL